MAMEIVLTDIEYAAPDIPLPPAAPGQPPRQGKLIVFRDPMTGMVVKVPMTREEAQAFSDMLGGVGQVHVASGVPEDLLRNGPRRG